MASRKNRALLSSRRWTRGVYAALVVAMATSMADAQSCLSLSGSTACSAFNMSSISTSDPGIVNSFPFLSFVTSIEEFDRQLNDYVKQEYVRSKYQNILGCSKVSLSNTTAYYARYTLSTVCNAIVQNSIKPCKLSSQDAPPLCAATCAQQAESEEEIAVNQDVCGTPGENYVAQIRADFTNCALPADSLSGSCITGEENEPDECGFSTNLAGLCGYCGASSPNATDSCCVGANVTHRCEGVKLPAFTSLPPLFPSSTTATTHPSPSASTTSAPLAASSPTGLSPGAIAGIVIGSLVGAALLLGLIFAFCVCLRRRRGSQYSSPKKATNAAVISPVHEKSTQPPPGGRIARMTALEGSSNDERGGLDPMLAAEKRRYDQSDSDPYGDSTPSRGAAAINHRQGSLSSNSALGAIGGATTGEETTSLSGHGGHYSSPGDVTSGQSEQLNAFKDYYSSDNIHLHDKVAVLWAYQPRAQDEFELQRGDMLRIVGIWDDGWATGVRIEERADDWTGKHSTQRDSGISGHDPDAAPPSPLESGEVRAFPLVCVCLPEHWRKTIEGDASTDSMSSPPPDRRNNEPFSHF